MNEAEVITTPAGTVTPGWAEPGTAARSRLATLGAGLRGALAAAARQPRLLVACDYDGTLAPIGPDPRSVFPLAESVAALRTLAGLPDTTAAVISGRALRELATMSRLPDRKSTRLNSSH